MLCPRCQKEIGLGPCGDCANQLGGEFESQSYSKHVTTIHMEVNLPMYATATADPWESALKEKAKELGVKSE